MMSRRTFLTWIGLAPIPPIVPKAPVPAQPVPTFGVNLGAGIIGDPRWLWMYRQCATLHTDFVAPAYGADALLTVDDWPAWSDMSPGHRFFSQNYAPTGSVSRNDIDLVTMRIVVRSGGFLTLQSCIGLAWPDYTYGVEGYDSETKTQRYIFRRSIYGEGMMPVGSVVSAGQLVLASERAGTYDR